MRSLLIISIFSLIGSTVFSQNTGLYGKKFCVDIGGSGALPLINILNGRMYKSKGGALVEKIDFFDYSLRTGVSYALSNNFSLGLEVDVEFSNIAAPTELEVYDPIIGWSQIVDLRHEAFNTRTFVFMPRMSFTSRNGLLPIGLSHQIGFGLSRTKIIEKDYEFNLDPFNSTATEPTDAEFKEKFYNYENESAKGITLMYTLNVRTPINNFMMITYGVRYNINYGLGYSSYYTNPSTANTYYLSKNDVEYRIKRRRLYSLISFNIGMAFAL